MKITLQIGVAGLLLLGASAAHAQIGSSRGGANRGSANRGGATLPLPQGVQQVVSLDAYNTIIAQTQDENGQRRYTLIPIMHVYSGGIAALFGGASIPTALFVSPAAGGNGNRGGIGVSGFGGGGNQGGNAGGLGFNGSGINNGFFGAGNGSFQNPDGSFGSSQTSIVGPNGTTTPIANGLFEGPTF